MPMTIQAVRSLFLQYVDLERVKEQSGEIWERVSADGNLGYQ